MAKKTTKKAASKVATKKVAAKKAPAKKVATKKTATKKTAAKKVAVAKAVSPIANAVIPEAATRATTPAVSAPIKKIRETKIVARVDVGFGNSLYVRGEGAGLSWDKGTQMENESPYEWVFSSTQAKTGVVFKFLINDEVWAEGENQNVAAGGTSISSPAFIW